MSGETNNHCGQRFHDIAIEFHHEDHRDSDGHGFARPSDGTGFARSSGLLDYDHDRYHDQYDDYKQSVQSKLEQFSDESHYPYGNPDRKHGWNGERYCHYQ